MKGYPIKGTIGFYKRFPRMGYFKEGDVVSAAQVPSRHCQSH